MLMCRQVNYNQANKFKCLVKPRANLTANTFSLLPADQVQN